MTSLAWLTASNAFIAGPPLAYLEPDDTLRQSRYGRAVLDRELHAFAGDDDLDARGFLVRLVLRFHGDAIERVVAPVGVVVIEHEPLHLRSHGDVDGARDGRVPPCRLEDALEELRVVDQRVGARRQRDDRIWFPGEGILGVRGIDERALVGLDPERERRCGMEDARRANTKSSDLLVAPILELADGQLRGQIVDVDRKERVVHSETEELAHRAGLLRAADAKGRPWVVRGAEERDALDVIPVKMREQEIHREGPVVGAVRDRGAELARASGRNAGDGGYG